MPTLIIVQVGLGREVHNLESNRNSTLQLTVNKNISTDDSTRNELPSLRSKNCHCSSNDTFVYHPQPEC